jgi:hypothetical protein
MSGKRPLTRALSFFVSPEDYDLLNYRFSLSTSHSLSAFCREILLSQPVTVRYHNVSADEFLVIALEIKKELEVVIAGLRQSPNPACPEDQFAPLVEKVEELKLVMHQIYQQWSSI